MKDKSCTSPNRRAAKTIADAGFDHEERILLEIMRHFFQSFAQPHSQGWIQALQTAQRNFPEVSGAEIAMATLAVVQNMRFSRREVFRFSNPNCASCRKTLCEDERHLLGIITALRANDRTRARTHALLLCEGNDTAPTLSAADRLVWLLADAWQGA